jgi:phosphate transport system permease protein
MTAVAKLDPGTDPGERRLRRGRRKTKRSVLIADKMADWTISVGGVLVIGAVFGIMAFLFQVVVPLFAGNEAGEPRALSVSRPSDRLLDLQADEYKTIAVAISADGGLTAFHLGTGTPIAAPRLEFGGRKATAFARTLDGAELAFGFDDGTVRFGRLHFDTTILAADAVPAGLRPLSDHDRTDGTAVYSEIPGHQVRKLAVSATILAPQTVADDGAAIVAIDTRYGGTAERPTRAFATLDAKGSLRLSRTEVRVNLLTWQRTETVATSTLPKPRPLEEPRIVMTEKADQVLLAGADGTLLRYDTRDFDQPVLAETTDLTQGSTRLAAMRFLIGEQSLVAGGSDGSVAVFFRVERPGEGTTDGYRTVRAKTLEPQPAAIVAIDASQRGKTFATADAQGSVWLRHSTSEQVLVKLAPPAQAREGFADLALAPRENGVVAFSPEGKAVAWDVSVPHPETTVGSVFGKVWYEGYDQPTYTWQSSSGTDSFEPKLSLVPLIFGTLKATIYSLLFAIPIALFGAIYTSEFVHRRVRATIKPVMEMMASLPSVVLGFIAALILAPVVETWIAAVLLAFVALPLSLLLAAYLWQLLPERTRLRFQGLPKFALMFVVLAIGIWAARAFGGVFEDVFFAGDIRLWLNGDVGASWPFLFLVSLPACFVLVAYGARAGLGDEIDARLRSGKVHAGIADFARWIAMMVAAAVFALVVALLLAAAGADARGGFVGNYVQRNTLVVGFAMGFAVIPIIYTIAEDALNAVPEHLRAASLACGATPWQTATSIILPTAMSGVFAAIMIGMGRAVGETMIVVMAAGNTPILDWNIFNGLRALSANIAVELPEAVKDGTLYRMLFLAALTLFVMTFVINTFAEIVRLRFRKRAAQL